MSVVFGNFGVSQAIQDVWENHHKLICMLKLTQIMLLASFLIKSVQCALLVKNVLVRLVCAAPSAGLVTTKRALGQHHAYLVKLTRLQ